MSTGQKNRPSLVGLDLRENGAAAIISNLNSTPVLENRQPPENCTPRVQPQDFDLAEFLNAEDNLKGERQRRLARLHSLRHRGVRR